MLLLKQLCKCITQSFIEIHTGRCQLHVNYKIKENVNYKIKESIIKLLRPEIMIASVVVYRMTTNSSHGCISFVNWLYCSTIRRQRQILHWIWAQSCDLYRLMGHGQTDHKQSLEMHVHKGLTSFTAGNHRIIMWSSQD